MRIAASLAALFLLTACSPSGPGVPGRTHEPAVTPQAPAPTPAATHGSACRGDGVERGQGVVLVYFACKQDLNTGKDPRSAVGLARHVDPGADTRQRLQRAVVEYLEGPSRSERRSFVSVGQPGMLNSVRLDGERAIIDVDLTTAGLQSTTSAQSDVLWAHLTALAFQFPEVTYMEPRFNGSCRDFGMAVQAGECLVATRDGGYVPGK